MSRDRPSSPSKTASTKKKGLHPVDRHVGLRVRQRRTILGLSQQSLGDHLGMSFQQVQKYESGKNRISASRLLTLAKFLRTEVGYFFEGLARDLPHSTPGEPETDTASGAVPLEWHKRETLELVRAYCDISDPVIREKLVSMITSCGQRA